MSVNPLTHLSNTICYIDKPSPSKVEQARLDSQRAQSPDVALRADSKKTSLNETNKALDPPDKLGKTADPVPTINAAGQSIGTILNIKA